VERHPDRGEAGEGFEEGEVRPVASLPEDGFEVSHRLVVVQAEEQCPPPARGRKPLHQGSSPSCANSVRTPKVDFGWRNPIFIP